MSCAADEGSGLNGIERPRCRWSVVAASVRGASHAKTGKPCQDANHWAIRGGAVLVAAVADGAGSAAHSDVGASVAVRAAVDAVQLTSESSAWPEDDEAWRALLHRGLQAACDAVHAEAGARAVETRDLATTLILLIATPDSVAAIQVGDGAGVIGTDAGDVVGLTVPQSGEYLNETTFITASDVIGRAVVSIWRGAVRHLAVFSDGIQMLALRMPQGNPHARFFEPVFGFARNASNVGEPQEELRRFLTSRRVADRTDDDVTLLLAARMDTGN
ncbi:MAG: protein phosphatase 2C domain-containing protein [Deltaproteobacteria bacterium]|nr:protein phosphatase 2C domain-containing protein [Deltaproteobacteria bacterium]